MNIDKRNAFFEDLISRYYDRIYALISRRIHNEEQVKDLTQDTFFVALTAYEKLVAHPNVGAWLMKTASNKVKASIRQSITEQARQIPIHINDVFTGGDGDLLKAMYYSDALKHYDEPFKTESIWFLSHLKGSDAEVLSLFYEKHMSIAEIAEKLNITDGTAKTRLSRARSRALRVIERRQDS